MFTPEQQAFVDARVLQIKRSLLRCWWGSDLIVNAHGDMVPMTVRSFSELHDYCDANELGGLCEDAGLIASQCATLFPPDGEDAPSDEWTDACNEIQSMVGAWLSSRRSVDDFALMVRVLVAEQVECLLDDERTSEARDMLDDLEARVGHSAESLAPLCALVPPASPM